MAAWLQIEGLDGRGKSDWIEVFSFQGPTLRQDVAFVVVPGRFLPRLLQRATRGTISDAVLCIGPQKEMRLHESIITGFHFARGAAGQEFFHFSLHFTKITTSFSGRP